MFEEYLISKEQVPSKVVLVASDCNGGAVLLKAMMNTSKQAGEKDELQEGKMRLLQK